MRAFLILFSSTMRFISALAVFRTLNRPVWLSELLGVQRKDGSTPKTSS